MASSRPVPCSIVTMSVRGTITSRTMVSPSSKTEWIILRSTASITSDSLARSTRSRSSFSDANGPCRKPRPGVTTLPTRTSRPATGPSSVVPARRAGATTRPTSSGCWRASVRGLTPTTTYEVAAMTTVAMSSTAHQRCTNESTTRATQTAAAASQDTRRKIATLTETTCASSSCASAGAPRRPSATSRAASARLVRRMAVSAAAKTPASTTRTTARTTNRPVGTSARPITRDRRGR